MARRGKCRCGAILRFHKTEQGYKTRCPECQAVVRLRVDSPTKPKKPRSHAAHTVPAPETLPADFTSPTLENPPPATDFSIFELEMRENKAPAAQVEMEVFREPTPPQRSSLIWFLLAGAALLVIAGVVAVLLS
jgi:hypothetical protein